MTVTEKEDALLSIGGLSRASGVSVETLRNWERRYGFPKPGRLTSGHRRYPWEVVRRLQLIRRAIDLGYKPSFAARASEQELRQALDQTPEHERSAAADDPAGSGAEIRSWLKSTLELDAAGLELGLQRAWSRDGALGFLLVLLIPFLRELGDRWEDGRMNVAHEHFASEVLEEFLARKWRPLSRRAAGPRVVLANLEGERHSLGLHIAAVFLALRGIEVVLLGPSTPLRDIALAANDQGADAVIIGLSAAADPELARTAIETLRADIAGSTALVVGGNDDVGEIKGAIRLETLAALDEWIGSVAWRPS